VPVPLRSVIKLRLRFRYGKKLRGFYGSGSATLSENIVLNKSHCVAVFFSVPAQQARLGRLCIEELKTRLESAVSESIPLKVFT
jgi:hypothetical protein